VFYDVYEEEYLRLGDIVVLALLATRCLAGFLLGIFFDPEDRGDMFLRNVG
jgi:hypothetical protein